ncbi:hypothetical protein FAES_2951 [Fibrella aestuarina BUZ 2]|uniref:Uncharacterized protein n=1 Tax=Fibrella aestuarina BUZ 2 TaxID=1166018 RepID=I0KA07_9BACT|nr:hypothetical protein FAES_2951 [Fibrella aestuarina BUZ 2]
MRWLIGISYGQIEPQKYRFQKVNATRLSSIVSGTYLKTKNGQPQSPV